MFFQVQVLLLIGAASLIHAGCPDVNAITNFDASQFAGRWYWTEWYNNGWLAQQAGNSIVCLSSTFTSSTSGNLSVSIIWKDLLTTVGGTAKGTFEDVANTPNAFNALFELGSPLIPGRYYVLDILYNTVAVVFYCQNYAFGLSQIEMAWVLHRNSRGLTTRQRNRLIKRWDNDPYLGYLIDPTKFVPFPGTDCTNYRN
ncbi:lazarillo protein-like [Mizuhopecten yessoensis]|uniref:Lazarillo protein n=1 Tax=Mizuhopecten yessoensis TaxID=6573 RepID=A0A210QPC7_MIZYE|nr:lazarillo protein-like [Mizuhopecten yessoensis]OWF50592.1 Lazarillo protein [Mizuhopecten yessoensis]